VALGTVKLSNGARLVKIRNPWGNERYKCDYNDESSLWTPALRQEAGATPTKVDDGLFFMKIEDYVEQGMATLVSFDTTDWFSDYFLKLSDKTVSPGEWSWCGATCTRHKVKVTSKAKQTVYVTAYTWDKRSYPLECQAAGKTHSIYLEDDITVYTFSSGSRQVDPLQFQEGESKTFILEFDWARKDVTPDWSVTAWADVGEVRVEHLGGLQTDHLPFQAKRVLPENKPVAPTLPPVDELQVALNNWVMNYEIGSKPGYCGFRLREVWDEQYQCYKSVAAHNCASYAVDVTLYMMPEDWNRVAREYHVLDEKGNVLFENSLVKCSLLGQYKTCRFHLSPENPRIGLMMKPGAYGLMTYVAQWTAP